MLKGYRMNPLSHGLAKALLAILLSVMVFGSSPLSLADEAAVANPARKGIPVEAVPVIKRTIRAYVYGQGTARAVRREFLSFESEGKITFIKRGADGRDLAAGDAVKGPAKGEQNGEILASVDSRDSLAQLDVALAALEQARQQQIAAGTDLDKAKADRQVATTDLKRMRKLVGKQVVSRSDFEKSEARAKQASAAVKAAKAKVQSAISAVNAAKAQVAQARLALERTSIFAPMDGIVAFVNIKEGQYFSRQRLNTSSEASALQTAPIVVIDPSEFEIVLDLPTFQGSAVRPGQKTYIFTGDLLGDLELKGLGDLSDGSAIQGEVFSVSPSINPGGRSIQVKVRARPRGRSLIDGQFVNCWIVVRERPDAIVLPYNTLLHEGKRKFVFVVDGKSGAVERRAVKLGIRGLHGVQVVSGLKAGEQVVGKGRNRLTDGTLVEVVAVRGEGTQ